MDFTPPHHLLLSPFFTKPRNPLPEVKPSLQQGSFPRLFTLNIFLAGRRLAAGPVPPPRPGRAGLAGLCGTSSPSPPTIPYPRRSAGTGAAQLRWQFVCGPRFPCDRPGKKTAAGFLCSGGTADPLSEGSRRAGARRGTPQKHNFCQESGRPPSPASPGRVRVLPRALRGDGKARGSGGGAGRGKAGREPPLSRET